MYDYESEALRVAAGEISRAQFLRRGLAAGVSATFLGQALIACGGDEPNGATGASGSGTSPGPSKLIAVNRAPTEPFDPNLKPGLRPDLPRRMGFPSPAGAELFTMIERVVGGAVESRGIEFITAQANGDSPKQFQQTQDFLARGVGSLLVFDLAPPALVPLQLKAMKQGVAVLAGPFANTTCQGTTDQYAVGHAAGVAAVKWVKENLGGNAEASLFNIDQTPSQKPKFDGVRDALKAGGQGIKLVSDVSVKVGDADEGFRLTNTILQRHPNVNVWLGGDGPLGGTLAALEAAGKDGSDKGLFSIGDGDAQALDAIVKGGPYKSTQAFPYHVLAYAWGKYAVDWLDGKSIPLVLKVPSFELNSQETIDAFNRVNATPASSFAENEKTFKYFTPLGNTSYEHNRYVTVVA